MWPALAFGHQLFAQPQHVPAAAFKVRCQPFGSLDVRIDRQTLALRAQAATDAGQAFGQLGDARPVERRQRGHISVHAAPPWEPASTNASMSARR